ncbi:MAG: hypothetical protein ISR55_05895 [Bacteroidetes bacterium]|nr:hypothetical protein [Bacteroidota bacterium]
MYRKTIVLFSVFLTVAFALKAQNYKHPYSHLGIGILEDQHFAANSGMAGFSIVQKSDRSFSSTNPASYSHLLFTTFDVALKGRIYNLAQGDSGLTTNLISFGYFALGFPISTKYGWGASFGLLPVSRIGYHSVIQADDLILPDSLLKTDDFEKNGGFNKAYLGTSIKLFKNLSVGANFYYLFGNTQLNHKMFFENNSDFFGVSTEYNTYFATTGIDFGAQFHTTLSKDIKFGMGATYSLPVSLKVLRENEFVTFINYGSGIYNYKDTLFTSSDDLADMEIPKKLAAGLSLYQTGKWMAGLEYQYEEWSKFLHHDTSLKLSNYQQFNFGFEFTPGKMDDPSYYKRMTYRFGIKYAFSYLNVPKDLDQFPVSFYNPIKTGIAIGAELPITRSLSALNTGIEFGKIGLLEDDIIRELYVNIYLGFRLNDIWFNKRKID